MTDIPKREELEKYAQQLAVLERAAMQEVATEVAQLAADRGYEIVAVPQIMPDGRLGAVWTLQRKQ